MSNAAARAGEMVEWEECALDFTLASMTEAAGGRKLFVLH